VSVLLSRRALLAGGGAAVAGAVAWSWRPEQAVGLARLAPADTLRSGYASHYAGALRTWWDPAKASIRWTNGGSLLARNGLPDNTVSAPSLWQMACLENVIFNDWAMTRSEQSQALLAQQWRYISRGVEAFTPAVLAGNARGVTINLSDDAAWHCWYLMHVHMATGDRTALAYLAEATVAARRRFRDPDNAANPTLRFGRSPNGQEFTSNRYGILYVVPGESGFGDFGKMSSVYEALLAITELYVHAQTGHVGYRDCAINTYRWIREKLRTPDPRVAAAATKQPVESRKAEGLYETELCLARKGGTPRDPSAGFLAPVRSFYGKPIRSLDSTYLNGAFAMGLLAARIGRLPETSDADRAGYFAEAAHVANTIIRPNAYGRRVGKSLLIANTRDPWTEAQCAVPFVREVVRELPGIDPAVPRAFADTARHILATCVTPSGRMTADWSGPELNFASGRSTWEADYAANIGMQAGAAQIMTHAQSLAMVQAGVAATA
jgi:hypothetical protein